MSSDRLARVLAPEYTADLEGLGLDEVRARRSECQEVELGLSYARRLVQGRLDIIYAQRDRAGTSGAPTDLSDLVEQLKAGSILSEHTRAPGFGRLPTLMAPAEAADDFVREIDEIAGSDALADVADLPEGSLAVLVERLSTLERSLSDRRKRVHERIDALQAEIVRRYKTGLANPDQLLS